MNKTFTEQLVFNALLEWELWGRQTQNNGVYTQKGKQEYWATASEMVRRYWLVGCSIKGRTGKDRKIPWSAAFISYCAKMAGGGGNFPYNQSHSVYLNVFKHTDNPLFDLVPINTQEYKVGDVIAYHRHKKGAITFENMSSRFNSHCDIVTAVAGGYIEVVGGNVGQSVTKKIIPLVDGKIDLKSQKLQWFAHCINLT